MYLLVDLISLFVKCLFKSFDPLLFIGLFIFLLLICRDSFDILGPPLDMHIMKIFS